MYKKHIMSQDFAKKYAADNAKALTDFQIGDYSSVNTQLDSLIRQAPNKSEEGRLKVLLGSSQMADGDTSKGVQTLKEVVNNYSIPAVWRATALYNLAGAVDTQGTVVFYKLYFNEAPYASFLPTEGSDVSRVRAAYLKLLLLSDEIYPTSFAEYSIAGNYYAIEVAAGRNVGTTTESAAQLMQKYVELGDSRNDQDKYVPSALVIGYLYRASAINTSARILNTGSLAERDAAFQKVLTVATQYHQDGMDTKNIALGALVRARFFYASFLATNFSDRDADIRALLKPFAMLDTNQPAWYLVAFTRIPTMKETDFYRDQSKKLIKISPEYKDFLQKLHVTP